MDLPLSHVWQPATSTSQWLLVVLHGLGDSSAGFLWLQDELGIDSLNLLLLDAPDQYYTGFAWYDIENPKPGVERSRNLLGKVLEATSHQGYPPGKTFLLGFSQGCLMTMEFGARYSSALAGYVGISGYCLSPDVLLREMNPEANNGRWLITHGLNDPLLPVEVTRAQLRKLKESGFVIDYREYDKDHTIDPERELPEIREWLDSRIG